MYKGDEFIPYALLMIYFNLYNYAIQNNLVLESYDVTWNCPDTVVQLLSRSVSFWK